MTTYGYVRTHSPTGDVDDQLATLRAAGVPTEHIYRDDQWETLAGLAGEGDTIRVSTIDRIGGNLTECMRRVEALREQGVTVVPDDSAEGVDAVVILASLRRVYAAERAAQARARRGAVTGRPGRRKALTEAQIARAAEAVDSGRTVGSVAAELGVSRRTVERRLRERRNTAT